MDKVENCEADVLGIHLDAMIRQNGTDYTCGLTYNCCHFQARRHFENQCRMTPFCLPTFKGREDVKILLLL